MQLKNLSKQEPLLVVSLGLVLFAAPFLYFFLKSSVQEEPVLGVGSAIVFSNQEQTSVGLPVRLKIPVIHVDSAVIPVGLTSDGAMDVPKGPAEVAWFDLGPRPGESGSAVIAGHYGWKNNTSAVFDNLHTLRKGDKIFVEDEKGLITTFVVREIRIYGKDEIVPDVFGSDDGKARLNLITCTGDWNIEAKTRTDRLVVFTEKE
ncbi:MAG: class F sortase [bacterium]|nr:class F sortase [bacterium]